MSFYTEQGNSSKSETWTTPRELFLRIQWAYVSGCDSSDSARKFTLDAAASV
jgi:hypothetical protein